MIRLPRSKNLSVLKSVHFLAKGVMRSRGYKWELRRSGESKLGLWKKSFRKRDLHQAYPRRLVILPGFGDTSLSWYPLMDLMNPFIRGEFDEVILIDFPGFSGFLTKERAFSSMDLMMAMVEDVLDSLKPHTLMGHSLGGWLSAHYAAQCGAGIRAVTNRLNYAGPKKIILTNPAGVFGSEKAKAVWMDIFTKTMEGGFEWLRPHLFAKEPLWFKWVESQFEQFVARDDILQFMKSVEDHHSVESRLEKIQSDVWVIWGEKDTLLPVSTAQAWLSGLSRGLVSQEKNHQLIFMRDSGHSPHIEVPAAYAWQLNRALNAAASSAFRGVSRET